MVCVPGGLRSDGSMYLRDKLTEKKAGSKFRKRFYAI